MINYWCKIEGCLSMVENPDIGLCATHARELRKKSEAKQKTPRKRISKQSDEGKERMDVYMAIRKLYFRVPIICSVCQGLDANEIHHKKGRIGDLLYDVRFWLPVHSVCHHYIETHPEEAYEKGWSLLRNANEPHDI